MLNKDFIQRKISLIQDELTRLTEFEDLTLEQIDKDFRVQAIVERILERVITRAIDVNQHLISELGGQLPAVKTYRDTFLKLAPLGVYPEDFAKKIAPCAGLRNALVHDYNNIDQEILHKSIRTAIQEFNDYTKYILSFLKEK